MDFPSSDPNSDDFPIFVVLVITIIAVSCMVCLIVTQYCHERLTTGGIGVSLPSRVDGTPRGVSTQAREQDGAYARVASAEEVDKDNTPHAFRSAPTAEER